LRISRLPVAIIEAWTRYFGLGGITAARSPVELLLLLIFGFLIMMGTVMLTQGVRKVPIHSTRRSAPVGPVGRPRFACAAGFVRIAGIAQNLAPVAFAPIG
jgi:preprotein translocase subunit SecY